MAAQKCSVKGLTLSLALLCGIAVLIVGLVNLNSPGYGQAFLDVISSVYPGYDAVPEFNSVLIGTGYALLDGAIGGLLLALLYNFFSGKGAE